MIFIKSIPKKIIENMFIILIKRLIYKDFILGKNKTLVKKSILILLFQVLIE